MNIFHRSSTSSFLCTMDQSKPDFGTTKFQPAKRRSSPFTATSTTRQTFPWPSSATWCSSANRAASRECRTRFSCPLGCWPRPWPTHWSRFCSTSNSGSTIGQCNSCFRPCGPRPSTTCARCLTRNCVNSLRVKSPIFSGARSKKAATARLPWPSTRTVSSWPSSTSARPRWPWGWPELLRLTLTWLSSTTCATLTRSSKLKTSVSNWPPGF